MPRSAKPMHTRVTTKLMARTYQQESLALKASQTRTSVEFPTTPQPPKPNQASNRAVLRAATAAARGKKKHQPRHERRRSQRPSIHVYFSTPRHRPNPPRICLYKRLQDLKEAFNPPCRRITQQQSRSHYLISSRHNHSPQRAAELIGGNQKGFEGLNFFFRGS